MAGASDVLDFLFEVGDLKRIRRSGWWACKIDDPESVSDHSFRTAIIAFYLANKENISDPFKIAFSGLTHDVSESRLLDLHKPAARYVKNKSEIEGKIRAEQERIFGVPLFPPLSSDEKTIVKDADLLEMALSAKEYGSMGYSEANILFLEAGLNLKSKTAKQLYFALKSKKPSDWFEKINKKK